MCAQGVDVGDDDLRSETLRSLRPGDLLVVEVSDDQGCAHGEPTHTHALVLTGDGDQYGKETTAWTAARLITEPRSYPEEHSVALEHVNCFLGSARVVVRDFFGVGFLGSYPL